MVFRESVPLYVFVIKKISVLFPYFRGGSESFRLIDVSGKTWNICSGSYQKSSAMIEKKNNRPYGETFIIPC